MSSGALPVGLAGLGLVGTALAARLIEGGYAVLGWDPDPARRAMLTVAGGVAADGLAALGRDCACVLIATFDAGQAADVIAAMPERSRLSTMIGVSTCDPASAKRLGRQAAERGWQFIEFPLSGTSRQIRDGAAAGLIGADSALAPGVAPLLEIVCPHHRWVGGVGEAAGIKLALNLVLQLNRAALAEGIVLAERLGLDTRAFLDVAQGSAAASAVMANKGPKMIDRDFSPDSRIAQTLKDADLILTVAATVGQPLPLMHAQVGLLKAAISSGGGDRDSAAVIEAIRDLAREVHET